MSILFISDIHLCEQAPDVIDGFLNFLYTRVITAKKLYILGDLFDIWIGDDNNNLLQQKISVALNNLVKRGISCYFIPGNHDFLLSKKYAIKCGMSLLPGHYQVLQFFGKKIVIMHGDILCTDDIDYQNFRRLTQQRWLQKLFLWLPLSVRLNLIKKIRINSINVNNKKKHMTDVNLKAVIDIMNKTGASVMIHGHTHRSVIHKLSYNKNCQIRISLGAWKQQGHVIEINTKKIILETFNLNKNSFFND